MNNPSVEIEGRTVYFNDFQTWPAMWCDAIEKTFPFKSEVDFGTVVKVATINYHHTKDCDAGSPYVARHVDTHYRHWSLIVEWRGTAMKVETEAYIEGSLWATREPVDVG